MTIHIAHRGNTIGPPNLNPQAPRENTIAAFEAAITAGAEMLEFDVRVTADLQPIVHHEANIQADWLRKLTLSQIRAKYAYIPTLEETLIYCKNRIRVDIEIKEAGHETTILNIIAAQLPISQYVITSFEPQVLQKIQHLNSCVDTGLLLSPNSQENRSIHQPQQIIDRSQPDFLAPHYSLINTSWLARINKGQLPYWVWTVNEAKTIAKLQNQANIQGIISDYQH